MRYTVERQGGEESVLLQRLLTCATEVNITSTLTSTTSYLTSTQSAGYATLVRNVGQCAFFLERARYEVVGDVREYNLKVEAGEETTLFFEMRLALYRYTHPSNTIGYSIASVFINNV